MSTTLDDRTQIAWKKKKARENHSMLYKNTFRKATITIRSEKNKQKERARFTSAPCNTHEAHAHTTRIQSCHCHSLFCPFHADLFVTVSGLNSSSRFSRSQIRCSCSAISSSRRASCAFKASFSSRSCSLDSRSSAF